MHLSEKYSIIRSEYCDAWRGRRVAGAAACVGEMMNEKENTMNLLEMLFGSMTEESSVKALSEKSGLSGKQITMLLAVALPILIKYLTKNASSQQGAQSLAGALGQHKPQQQTTMAQMLSTADQNDGNAILGHILGNNNQTVVQDLSQQTGIGADQVGQVLSSLAPALLSGLATATTAAKPKPQVDLSDGLDLTDVMGLLGSAGGQSKPQASGVGGLLGSLLGQGSTAQTSSASNGTDLLGSLMSLMK